MTLCVDQQFSIKAQLLVKLIPVFVLGAKIYLGAVTAPPLISKHSS